MTTLNAAVSQQSSAMQGMPGVISGAQHVHSDIKHLLKALKTHSIHSYQFTWDKTRSLSPDPSIQGEAVLSPKNDQMHDKVSAGMDSPTPACGQRDGNREDGAELLGKGFGFQDADICMLTL